MWSLFLPLLLVFQSAPSAQVQILDQVVAIVDDDIIDDDIEFDSDNGLDVGDDGPGIIQDDIGEEDELMPNLDDKDEN